MAKIGDECMPLFQDMKLHRKYRYIIFKISDLKICVDKKGSRDENYEDFIGRMPGSNCRYALYDYEYLTADKRATSKIYLIAWSPPNANDHDRVTFTQALPVFVDKLTGVFKANANEEEDLEELLSNEHIS